MPLGLTRHQLSVLSVILIGFLVMFFSSSIKNVFQVYFVSIADSFDLSRSEFSWSGSAFMLVTGVGSWIAGYLCDRFGAKSTLVLGTFLAGLAFVVSATAVSFPVFVAMYGVVGALALAAMQFVPMGVLVDEAFSDKHKGLVYAIVTNGTGIGFVVLSPLWVYLNLTMDWQEVFLWIGLLFLVPIAPLVIFGLRAPPNPEPNLPTDAADTWVSAMGHPAFWFLAVSFFGCGINMAFIDIHYVPMMQDGGIDPSVVATSLSVLGAVEIAGGFLAGWLSGRMGWAMLLSAFYAVRAMSGLLLYQSTTEFGFVAFAALFGATYLGTVILTSLFCLRFFGKKNKGTVFGLLFLLHQVGAFLCTWLGAELRDVTGDYQLTLAAATGFSLLSAVIALLLLGQTKPATETSRA